MQTSTLTFPWLYWTRGNFGHAKCHRLQHYVIRDCENNLPIYLGFSIRAFHNKNRKQKQKSRKIVGLSFYIVAYRRFKAIWIYSTFLTYIPYSLICLLLLSPYQPDKTTIEITNPWYFQDEECNDYAKPFLYNTTRMIKRKFLSDCVIFLRNTSTI